MSDWDRSPDESSLRNAEADTRRAEYLGRRAYSTDLKERLVRAVAEGQPMRAAARRFDVAVTTVKRAVVQARETGSLERRPIPGYPRRIGPEQLAPTLRPGQVVVLDKLSVHKAASIRQGIEARHCHLLFLPPYSPDFTPIEQAFSKSKAVLRGLGARTKEALWEAMRMAVEAITPAGALAWFAHAGYGPVCPTYLKVALGQRRSPRLLPGASRMRL